MKRISKTLLLAAAVAAASAARADEVFNLATGLDSSGNVWATGDGLDANWTITSADNYLDYPNAYTVFPGQADWYGGWFANGPDSDWIAADPDVTDNGNLVASTSFDLTASQLAGATFSGTEFSIDDEGYLYLNGNEVAFTPDGNWGSWETATIPTSDLVAGVNTLTMYDYSDDYLEAVRFQGTLTVSNASSVPGPLAGIPMLLGLGGLGLRRKRRG